MVLNEREAWTVAILGAFVTRKIKTNQIILNGLLILLFLVGLFSRLALAYFPYGNYDQESYEIVAGIMSQHQNVYAETERYNYSPIWSYFLYGLKQTGDDFKLPYHFMIRSFLTLVDLVNALLIGLISSKNAKAHFRWGFLAYWLNPVAILIIGFHGQFENLATTPLLIAVYLLESGKAQKHINPWIWVLGTLSVMIKQITVFSVIVLFLYTYKNRYKTLGLLAASAGMFLLSFLPYIQTSNGMILKHVFLYQSNGGLYGLTVLLPYQLSIFIFFVGMTAVILSMKGWLKSSLIDSIELSTVSFLALTHGIGEQYFLLPVLWGSIQRKKWFWIFTFVAGLFLLTSTNNLNLKFIPNMWNSVWLAAIGWMLSFYLSWKVETHSNELPVDLSQR